MVCSWFGDSTPTKTTLEKTREALEVWSISKAKPKYQPTIDGKTQGMLYQFTPLEDIIAAQLDLRRTSLLMAWLIGKTDFDTAMSSLESGDDCDEKPAYLKDYYEKLKNNSGNILYSFNMEAGLKMLHQLPEESIESFARSYVSSAFTILMSNERNVCDEGTLFIRKYFNTAISGAWAFFATGLNKEEGASAIIVCKHCSNFFEQKRSTKQFCSDSCRVMYLRNSNEKK